MFKVNLEQVKYEKGASLHYEWCEKMKPLKCSGEVYPFAEPVHVSLDFVNYGEFIGATGKIKTALEMTCCRCLEKFICPLNVDFNEKYCETSLSFEDFITFSGDTVFLEQQLVEALLLSLPMKPVCSDNCRGLCPSCGQNLNQGCCSCRQIELDPRLAKLKELLNNK